MAQSDIIYLDHNATTPIAEEVFDAIRPFLRENFGNPSSTHAIGRKARDALMESRERVASRLGAGDREVVFTAGGTEANNLSLLGIVDGTGPENPRRRIVISAVEHHAVLHPARELARRGFEVELASVDRDGRLDLEAMDDLLDEETLLVSVMMANNETGAIFPVEEVASLAHSRGALVHTDAVQASGKFAFTVDELGVDLLTLSAHKFYGPKGVGALYVRKGTPFRSPIRGGNQERRRRPGTQNVAGIVGLATALDLCSDRLATEESRLASLRDELESQILTEVSDAFVNGGNVPRTANTASLRFDSVDGEALVDRLDRRGYAVSTGAACAAGSIEPSHVLLAMGLTPSEVQGSIRVSLGRETTKAHLSGFASAVAECVGALRDDPGAAGPRVGEDIASQRH